MHTFEAQQGCPLLQQKCIITYIFHKGVWF